MMKRETITNELLNEKCIKISHDSGLTIYCYPKPGFAGSYAIFGTNYGSIDTMIPTENGISEIPNGTAHFLEHKLFESEDLDAFDRFAKTGASANAFTSFDSTCYLFSCTGDFEASLRILLDFVQSPYFTEETVAKEQGIIGQEITMYKDIADWEVLFNLLRTLYHKHPVMIDIAGTKESISRINAKMLYDCYNSFYNLNNMALAVAGNIDVDTVVRICDEVLNPSEPFDFKRPDFNEPRETVSNYIEEELSVAAPIFNLGFKESTDKPLRSVKEKVAMTVLLSLLADPTSSLYNEMLNDGLINSTFGWEQFLGYGFAATIFSGESEKPEEVADRIKKHINKVRAEGIDHDEFEMIRRKLYGKCIMGYDDYEDVAGDLVAGHFNGSGVFEDIEAYRDLTINDVKDILDRTLIDKYSSLSVIKPIK